MLSINQLAWVANAPVCRTESGQATHSGVELSLQAASWDVGEPEAPQGSFQMGQERKHGHSGPWQREKASAVLAGPQAGVQLGPACPHTCWEDSRTCLSLPTPLAAQLSHASLSGAVRGCNGMTTFPGHSGPSWAHSPQGQPHQWLTRTALLSWRAGPGFSGNHGRVVKSLTSPRSPPLYFIRKKNFARRKKEKQMI